MQIPNFEIRSPKFPVGWLTRPGSQQLGAKWVEVTKRRAQDADWIEESEFENVASNTR